MKSSKSFWLKELPKIKKRNKNDFINGKSVEEIANDYNFSKLTISRNLKNLVGKERYKIINNSKKISNSISKEKNLESLPVPNENQPEDKDYLNISFSNNEMSFLDTCVEISPLYSEIDSSSQKELAQYL